VDEVVEAGLLLQGVHSRRPGCFLFDGEVHALLLGMIWFFAGIGPADLATASGTPLETVPFFRSERRRLVPGAHAGALLAALHTFGIVTFPKAMA
jgi:hypothetical protein